MLNLCIALLAAALIGAAVADVNAWKPVEVCSSFDADTSDLNEEEREAIVDLFGFMGAFNQKIAEDDRRRYVGAVFWRIANVISLPTNFRKLLPNQVQAAPKFRTTNKKPYKYNSRFCFHGVGYLHEDDVDDVTLDLTLVELGARYLVSRRVGQGKYGQTYFKLVFKTAPTESHDQIREGVAGLVCTVMACDPETVKVFIETSDDGKIVRVYTVMDEQFYLSLKAVTGSGNGVIIDMHKQLQRLGTPLKNALGRVFASADLVFDGDDVTSVTNPLGYAGDMEGFNRVFNWWKN